MSKTSAKTINLNGKTIAELKKMAQALNIGTRPTWGEEDYRRAIINRQKHKVVASVVDDMSSPIPEGFSRIEILSTGGGANEAPVQCLVNKFPTIIPRGVIVDVPIEVVDNSLANSVNVVTKNKLDPKTGFEDSHTETEQAIPFREYGRSPGRSVIEPIVSADKMSVRNQYRSLYGKWPNRTQQAEFEKELRTRIGDARLEAFVEAQRQLELERAKTEVAVAMSRLEETNAKKPGRPKKVEVAEEGDGE